MQNVISAIGSPQTVEDLCILFNFQQFCGQNAITTANGVNQGPNNSGASNTPGQLTSIQLQAYNAASLDTDGFDLESTYQFDLQDYDVPGSFVLRSLINHTSKYISDSGIPGTQRNVELAGNLGGGGNSSSYNQSGGNVLTWKLEETQSYETDTWGADITERWYAGGTFTNKNDIVCAPGTCPILTQAQLTQTPTINYNAVDSIMYLDIGVHWNVSDKTQLYGNVDNITNIRPPDTGTQTVNNTLYDVIGRMYRIGVRFTN